MIQLTSTQELDAQLASKGLVLAYFTTPDCGVCKALKPKLEEVLAIYESIRAYEIDVAANPDAAGQHSIFTLPGLLVYADGKEYLREARYMSVASIESQLARLVSLYN